MQTGYRFFLVLIICVVSPPILYIVSVNSLEKYLYNKIKLEVENAYIINFDSLIDGRSRIKYLINENIDTYKKGNKILDWIECKITIKTKNGVTLYPLKLEHIGLEQLDPLQIAANNYDIMRNDFETEISIKINHNTFISNTILGFFLTLFLGVLFFYYRIEIKKADLKAQERKNQIYELIERQDTLTGKLIILEKEREQLASETARIKSSLADERLKAQINEEDMLKEMISIDEALNEKTKQYQQQQTELESLKTEINFFEKQKKSDDQRKTKLIQSISDRFSSLYSEIIFEKRAIEGFSGLSEGMQIKAESVIQQLSHKPEQVVIKRKVFMRKGKGTVLEVIFGYRGRLYFCNTKENKIMILSIGTKNTQLKDLDFIEKMS